MPKILVLDNSPSCCNECQLSLFVEEEQCIYCPAENRYAPGRGESLPDWCPLVKVTDFTAECPSCGSDNVVYTRAVPIALECERCGAHFETGFG
jgi:hypothetical protein